MAAGVDVWSERRRVLVESVDADSPSPHDAEQIGRLETKRMHSTLEAKIKVRCMVCWRRKNDGAAPWLPTEAACILRAVRGSFNV